MSETETIARGAKKSRVPAVRRWLGLGGDSARESSAEGRRQGLDQTAGQAPGDELVADDAPMSSRDDILAEDFDQRREPHLRWRDDEGGEVTQGSRVSARHQGLPERRHRDGRGAVGDRPTQSGLAEESPATAGGPDAAASASSEVDPAVDDADESPDLEQQLIAALQKRGKCSGGDLARARKLTEDSGDPLRTMLVRLGLVSERDMAAASAEVLGIDLIGAEDYPDSPVAEEALSLRFLKDSRLVPLFETDDALHIAVADPLDDFVTKALAMATGKKIILKVGLPTEIQAALERLYEKPEDDAAEAEAQAELGNFSEEDIEHLRDLASEAPVIRMVNQILQRAVELRASDVHIEPFADQLKVRYRIDGILKEADSPPVSSTAAVISRVKIMAKLNIAERRLPQDGRIPQRIQGKELDLRVSTVPTMFGESVVMRLLDKESVSFDFDALGFDGPPRDRLIQVLDQPYGIFLVTGPTGSGKSTTLYTALSRLNTEDRKIITVEDPVEYQVAGINQIPVKSSIGMTFAGALRAIVRQDPDIIMVGEMRDLETARIAVQSALTGHVVLSTLHTNDAASGVTRLLDMGVEDYLLTSTINGILAQRLVRRLCPHCREPYEPLPELAAKIREAGLEPRRAGHAANGAPLADPSRNDDGSSDAAAGRSAELPVGSNGSCQGGVQGDVGRRPVQSGASVSVGTVADPADAQADARPDTQPDGPAQSGDAGAEPLQVYRAVGCKHCNHSGYRGRLVIAEVLLMSDRIRQAVLGHATAGEIHRIAVEEGMATMYRDGLRKAVDGRTTIEEVIRVAEDK